MKNILFLVPYPIGSSPSQRFRFEQYFSHLGQNGFKYTVQSFLSESQSTIQLDKTGFLTAAWAILSGFIRRTGILFTISRYDFVFIHREAAPVGPPVFEWVIAKVLKKRIIYDFDDAIWLTDRVDEPPWLALAKSRSKVEKVCRWSYKVSCGNLYLCEFAKRVNQRVIFIPTTIDTGGMHVPGGQDARNENLVIGWTGSSSTVKYLRVIEPALKEIATRYRHVKFAVIADVPPTIDVPRLHFVRWSKTTEITDLQQFDIGIMPLPDDEWSKGKCGFKALQYMALEIPPVASPVGVNGSIIDHGKNGYLATSLEDWVVCLSRLIENRNERQTLGAAARKTVHTRYSVEANLSSFLSLFA